MDLKDHIKGKVTFEYFRDNNLFYKTEAGLIFPVPVADTDKGVFLKEDKAMFFMRYIRKHLDSIRSDAV